MSWLTNVPEHRIKQTHVLDKAQIEELEDLLTFVQRDQPATQLDHLTEEIVQWYIKRKRDDFPTPGKLSKLSFSLPESIETQLQALVQARHDDGDDSATSTHIVAHAVELYLASHGALLKAWREDVKRRGEPGVRVTPEKRASSEQSLIEPSGLAEPTDDVREEGVRDRAHTQTFVGREGETSTGHHTMITPIKAGEEES